MISAAGSALIGSSALWFVAGMSLLSGVVGWRADRAGRRALHDVALGHLVAALLASIVALSTLVSAFLARDFSLRAVASASSLMLSRREALAGAFADAPGLGVWALVVLLAGTVVAALRARRSPTIGGPLLMASAALVAAAAIALQLMAPPFAPLSLVPDEGWGLNPQLRHPAMPWQPLLATAGLVLTAVPCLLATLLLLRSPDGVHDAWRHDLRRIVRGWALVTWWLITLALLVGCWWAQHQLGWFGYYFTWEPYASAPLLPWLALSALLLLVGSDADRAAAPAWSWAFVAFACLLSAFAYVRVRVGPAASIRAVAASPTSLVVGLGAATLVVLLALSALRGWRDAWGRARVGAMLTLVGTVLAGSALAASPWRTESLAAVEAGEVLSARDPFGTTWRFTSQGLSSYQELDHAVSAVALSAMRGTRRVGLLTSRSRRYVDALDRERFEPSTSVGNALLWHESVAVAFLGRMDGTTAAVRVSFVPLVAWLWVGGALLLIGVPLMLLAPTTSPRRPDAAALATLVDQRVDADSIG